jgi:hypothetical protein
MSVYLPFHLCPNPDSRHTSNIIPVCNYLIDEGKGNFVPLYTGENIIEHMFCQEIGKLRWIYDLYTVRKKLEINNRAVVFVVHFNQTTGRIGGRF